MQFVPSSNAAFLGDKRMSVLGFGCAALMGRASRAESLRALGTALEAGVNFFDTARSYGYGAAEGLLGQFLSAGGTSRREEVVICTKFGILPRPRNWKHAVKPVARAAIRLVPSLRQAAQRQAANQLQGGQFSVSTLKHSFEQSLRELRTDYADMLMLHDAPAAVLTQSDLLEAMERLVVEGKARAVGVSADQAVIASLLGHPPAPLTAAQVPINLDSLAMTEHTSAGTGLTLIANHPFGGPRGVAGASERIAELCRSSELSAELRARLSEPDPQTLPELVFNAILSGTCISALISAMIKPQHIASNVQAVESCRFTAAELAAIRRTLAAQVAKPELVVA